MGILKGKAEGGQGGKRGHSNMDHWVFSEELKEAARRRRRLNAKLEIREALVEYETAPDNELDRKKNTNEFPR